MELLLVETVKNPGPRTAKSNNRSVEFFILPTAVVDAKDVML